ncbi:unnamed protein product [Nesidiocoris tenuis]|uniref:Uncharacterized protein n=1 Tax=Nesidiocoris tenuis TaxID=355587 RepID=A0A6H5GXR5_9HEMI|nr:unnamed protein product [Nesidiocoris tenuis]
MCMGTVTMTAPPLQSVLCPTRSSTHTLERIRLTPMPACVTGEGRWSPAAGERGAIVSSQRMRTTDQSETSADASTALIMEVSNGPMLLMQKNVLSSSSRSSHEDYKQPRLHEDFKSHRLQEDFKAQQRLQEDFKAQQRLQEDFKAQQRLHDDFKAQQRLQDDFKAPQWPGLPPGFDQHKLWPTSRQQHRPENVLTADHPARHLNEGRYSDRLSAPTARLSNLCLIDGPHDKTVKY